MDSFHIARLLESYQRNPKKLYVIMTADCSTLLKDPGLDRPWATPTKSIAEFHAKEVMKTQRRKLVVVPLDEALKHIISHPKNQPGRAFKS